MITSAAGYPLDTTFYQAVKGLTGCLPIVKQGGTIILAASLTEGLGSPEFQSALHDHATLDAFMQRILGKDYFVMDQWQVEELAKVRRRTGDGSRSSRTACRPRSSPRATSSRRRASSRRWPTPRSREYRAAEAQVAVIPKGPYVPADRRRMKIGIIVDPYAGQIPEKKCVKSGPAIARR